MLIREGSTSLARRVRDRLSTHSGITVVGVGEGDADVIVDLRVGDHDGLARRRSSATVEGEALMEEVRRVNARRIVLLSSALVYGPHANNALPLTEDAIVRPDHSFVFARQLAAVEHVVDRWRRGDESRRVTVLRPTVTMAIGSSSALARALAAGSGRVLGEADPAAQFLHLDDLASAIELAVTSELDGVLNVAPDGWVPGDRVRRLSPQRFRVPIPGRLADTIWALQWRFQRGPIPPGVGPYLRSSWVVANDRIRSLGWEPKVTNEQAFVEGTEDPWWAAITPKRRQELALGAAAATIVAAVSALVAIIFRSRRRH